jgi:hypothetical protein
MQDEQPNVSLLVSKGQRFIRLVERYPYYCTKTYQFKLSVKDDNYDFCKTANIKIEGREV